MLKEKNQHSSICFETKIEPEKKSFPENSDAIASKDLRDFVGFFITLSYTTRIVKSHNPSSHLINPYEI